MFIERFVVEFFYCVLYFSEEYEKEFGVDEFLQIVINYFEYEENFYYFKYLLY